MEEKNINKQLNTIKKTLLILLISFVSTIPTALANDGGAWPDYNEYITYTVETDCTEIAIGEEIEFTMTITNHIDAEFRFIYMTPIFLDTYMGAEEDFHFADQFPLIKPYSINEIVFTYTIPEHIGWYKEGDNFYANLSPVLTYSLSDEYEYLFYEGELPYDFFTNMIGVESIPIKLTNVYDGSLSVNMEIIDDNEHFVYSDRYPSDFKGSYTYMGEYKGGVINYLLIENKSAFSYDVVYIDGYEWEFINENYPLILECGDSIIIDTGYSILRLPDDIPEYEQVSYNMMFKDVDGNYYGVTREGEYKTIIYERLDIEALVTKVADTENGSQIVNISIQNVSNNDIEDFFIYYGVKFPETEGELSDNIRIEEFDSDEVISLLNILMLPMREELEDSSGNTYYNFNQYNLRIGYWNEGFLCYWKLEIPHVEYGDSTAYTFDYYSDGIYTDVYDLLNDIEVFDVEYFLRYGVIPEPETTPVPENTTITPTLENAPIITNTSIPTTNIKVVDSKSYVIPPWVFVVLGLSALLVIGLIVYSKRKHKAK